MNPHNITICIHAYILKSQIKQLIVYDCAFIISNNDTDFIIKPWWILYKLRAVNIFKLFTNTAYIIAYNG